MKNTRYEKVTPMHIHMPMRLSDLQNALVNNMITSRNEDKGANGLTSEQVANTYTSQIREIVK
jgi:hypothetical protein